MGEEGDGFQRRQPGWEEAGECWGCRGVRCGRGGVEEGVIGGEVVSMVNAREVVEVGVLDKVEAVEGVHSPIETCKGEGGGCYEDETVTVEEVTGLSEK